MHAGVNNTRRLSAASACAAAMFVMISPGGAKSVFASAPASHAASATRPASSPATQPATRPAKAEAAPANRLPEPVIVAEAIRDLGDSSWRVREEAQRKLASAGPPALPQLEKALASRDAEVSQRASAVVSDIRKDLREGESNAMEKARLWKAPVPEGITSPPAVGGGIVCFHTLEGVLQAVEANTGKAKWSFDEAAKEMAGDSIKAKANQLVSVGFPSLPPPFIDGERVYVAAQPGRLYALGLDKGDVKWKSATAAGFAPPAASGGKVFAAGSEKDILAWDAVTGREIWRGDLAAGCAVRPAVLGGKVYAAGRDNQLYAFDANTGNRGKIGSELAKDATDLLVTGDGGLIVRTSEGISRVDLAAGKAAWTYSLPLNADMVRAVAQAQAQAGAKPGVRRQSEETLAACGSAIYTSYADEVHAIDASNGKSLWTWKAELSAEEGAKNQKNQVINFQGRVVIVGGGQVVIQGKGVIMVGNGGGQFFVRDGAVDGTLSIPCVDGERLYVASSAGLHCVDIKTRAELWRLASAEMIAVRPVVADGVLYYGAVDVNSLRNGAAGGKAPANESGLHAIELRSTTRTAK
jgi:outer membrane protein assembly factor BamB